MQECRMHDRGARDNHRYLKLVRANAVLSDENGDWVKTGEGGIGPKGKEERERGRERPKERCGVLSPWYQEQRDARSQTYEEAIVRQHFAPVTGARQWPPLTRPVTVSLFVDNA